MNHSEQKTTRRDFIRKTLFLSGVSLIATQNLCARGGKKRKRPNVIYVFADQWRAQDLGCAGNMTVKTPHLDRLHKEGLAFETAVSCMPVSTPYRGSFLTGQYALTHGLFLNDVQLNPQAESIGKCYKKADYNTAYIGKWHLNGNGRSAYILPEHRHGFDYFKTLECTHEYNKSVYYENNDTQKKQWQDYDAIAQTDDAIHYIEQQAKDHKPFFLVLSWGPPHNPYETAPEKYQKMYANLEIPLRPNVPDTMRERAIKDIRGYYAHCTALDDCVGRLQKAIKDSKIENDTIFVFTSDHGDMLFSQGVQKKQKPFDESIRVPFILKYPALFGRKGRKIDTLLNTPDIMPTLLSLSGLPIPSSVEGNNLAPILQKRETDTIKAALIECITPFGEWARSQGGKEYRGIRTKRYTYTRDLNGAWLLFDNLNDPYQMNNLIGKKRYVEIEKELDTMLLQMLQERNDEFLPGPEYINHWGYKVNKQGTVEYIK